MGGRGEGEKPPQSSAERAAKCGEKKILDSEAQRKRNF